MGYSSLELGQAVGPIIVGQIVDTYVSRTFLCLRIVVDFC